MKKFYVCPNANGRRTGQSWEDAFTDIDQAPKEIDDDVEFHVRSLSGMHIEGFCVNGEMTIVSHDTDLPPDGIAMYGNLMGIGR